MPIPETVLNPFFDWLTPPHPGFLHEVRAELDIRPPNSHIVRTAIGSLALVRKENPVGYPEALAATLVDALVPTSKVVLLLPRVSPNLVAILSGATGCMRDCSWTRAL
jgi:hypothetical protein